MSLTAITQHLTNLEVFEHVVSTYQEVVSTGGGLNTGSTFEANHGTAVVRASLSDLIADVELSAKRVLNIVELNYFNRWYKTTVQLATEGPLFLRDFDAEVRSKLGAEFSRVGIYPLKQYFAPVDTRTERGSR